MVSKKISVNKERLLEIFNGSSDLVVYEFETNSGIRAMICYIEGFIDKDLLDRDVLKPLILNLDKVKHIKKVIFVTQINEIDSIDQIVHEVTYGKVALFFEGSSKVYTVEINKWPKRAIEQPQTELVARGPKEGFIEDIVTNKAMLRRKLRNNNLVFEDYLIGKQTRTKVSIAYIKGIVNEKVLQELKSRLEKIDIDSILESGYIEELIADKPLALFSTVTVTEKPDIVAGKLLEGRVAIFTDGTPHVLTVPRLLVEGFMTSEDYYLKPYYSSFLRLLRVLSLFVAIYLPGIAVALQLYHQDMIPTVLLISIAGARQGVPLPVFLETFVMVIILGLVRESSLRLPKNISATVSIVGGLILGQAAVEAGLVSAITIIVVSASAITEFIIAELAPSIIIYRLIILFLGGVAGLYGTTCGFVVITMGFVSADSFGVPYTWPIAPKDWQDLKSDTFLRLPIWKNIFRPKGIVKKNIRRQIPPWR